MALSQNEIIRISFSVALIPIGGLMVALHNETPGGVLISHIGFAFIVAGVLSTFHETVLRRFEHGDFASEVADEVERRIRLMPIQATGIRLLSGVRKGMDKYYEWAISTAADDVFLAGRSVLHRVDADFRARELGTAAEIICKRLSQGAKIKILFVDPRSSIVPRLANEEGQTSARLLSDIAVSLGQCIQLSKLLNGRKMPPGARLDICVFDQIPYFAYHRVGDQIILGFYFSSTIGHQSAAYDVVDPKTKEFFAEHFLSIFSRAAATYVLRLDGHGGRPDLNEALIADLRKPIAEEIGELETERLMYGPAP